MQQCQVRVLPQIFVLSFDPNEWCLKNGLHSGGSNLQPISYEFSALTTRPRLLAFNTSVVLFNNINCIVYLDLLFHVLFLRLLIDKKIDFLLVKHFGMDFISFLFHSSPHIRKL